MRNTTSRSGEIPGSISRGGANNAGANNSARGSTRNNAFANQSNGVGVGGGNRGGGNGGNRGGGGNGGGGNGGGNGGGGNGGGNGGGGNGGGNGGGGNGGGNGGGGNGGGHGGGGGNGGGHGGGGHGGGNHGGGGYGHYYGYGYGYWSNFNQFYLSRYGFGYFGNGFGLSIGFPFFGAYNYIPTVAPYCADYFYQPYYSYYASAVDYVPGEIVSSEYLPGEYVPGEYVPAEYVPGVPTEVGDDGVLQPTVAPDQSSSNEGSVIVAAGHAGEYQMLAEQAFRERRYDDAARLVNHALIEDGNNGKLHLFASQALFALGDYRASAAAIQRGAAVLDRNEWGFVVENFKKFYRGKDYVMQMDELVKFMKENPDEAYAYFLRGYHYKYLGYDEAARKQLARAVELESRDQLAAELLVLAGGQRTAKPAINDQSPPDKPADAVEADQLQLTEPSDK